MNFSISIFCLIWTFYFCHGRSLENITSLDTGLEHTTGNTTKSTNTTRSTESTNTTSSTADAIGWRNRTINAPLEIKGDKPAIKSKDKKGANKSTKKPNKKAKLASKRCNISTEEDLHAFIDIAEEEEKINLFEFNFTLHNYNKSAFSNITGLYFKPWLWYTTRSRHGRTLLMLSFHYDVLSMNILTIGVKKLHIELTDAPFGCFGQLDTSHQVQKIRVMLLGRVKEGRLSTYGSSSREEFACNQEINDNNGDAEFVYNCCTKESGGSVHCSSNGNDFWISILYFAIWTVKIFMFLFCPKFVPQNIYSVTYAASEYVVTLKKALKMKIFISEKTDANVRFRSRVTLEQISDWWRFRNTLDSLPCDEIIPLKMDELRIKVKGKRIIAESDPPTGLLRTIFDNLVRCKIKNLDPFKDCCESSIYASMETKFGHQITWHKFVQMLIKIVMLLLLPFPYYIRLIIYFNFEEQELNERRVAIARNDMHESFTFYRTNVIQYFSPNHALFIATYIFYFLCGVIIGFSDHAFREKLKGVSRHSLADMSSVSKSGVLGIIIRTLLYPFKRWGLLAFLVGPFYIVCVFPFCAIVFSIYCIPTVYLSLRLPFHAKKLSGNTLQLEEERMKKLKRVQKLGRKISKIDKSAHLKNTIEEEESCLPSEIGFGGLATIQSIFIQIISSIFCLCILYSLALVFSESIGLFVEVMAFTMMGIIVNAGSVLKYVSMVLLVFVYMNDCYSNVYDNYLTFNKTLIDDMIDRTTADLRKIASMPSSMQANTAFVVKRVDEEKDNTPTLNFDKKVTRWRLGQLLLYLDSFDTPRIPLRLFQKLCEVRVHGAPGPVYINLLMATGKFMIIVVFLMFVMIVVMAFGNMYQMSSTNTTLATLAGGFVPMLLKNVLSSKGTKLSLKTVSFKGQIDEIIDKYNQFWPVLDLVVQRDIPEEPSEDATGEGGEDEEKYADDMKGIEGGGGGGAVGGVKGGENNGKGNGNGEISMGKRNSIDILGNGKCDKSDETETTSETIIIEDGLFPGSLNSEVDENLVDLFIDLSVADAAAGWSIRGSSESLHDLSMNPPTYEAQRLDTHEEEKSMTNSYRYFPANS